MCAQMTHFAGVKVW